MARIERCRCDVRCDSTKLPRKPCDVGLRCEKTTCFLRLSNAKCLQFVLSLRFGLGCERPRCQIASDMGRAMQATSMFRRKHKVAIEVAIYRMGNQPDTKIPGNWKEMEKGPGPEAAEKLPKNCRWWPSFGHFGPGALFHFRSLFWVFTNCAKMVVAVVSQLKQNQNKKKNRNHDFSSGIWFWLLSNKHQLLHKKQ